MVSISRRAGPPQQGHVVFRKFSDVANGEIAPPSKDTSSGSFTGN